MSRRAMILKDQRHALAILDLGDIEGTKIHHNLVIIDISVNTEPF